MTLWIEFADYAAMFLRRGIHINYNEYCLSVDGSKFCVATGFWLIIMSSDIVIAPK